MTAAHRFAARGEERLGSALKTERVKNRSRFRSAPDVWVKRLPTGYLLQGESKARRKLPAWIWSALRQTDKYTPGAVSVVALFEHGSREALAVVRLRDLARLLGIEPPKPGEQLALSLGGGQ